MSQRIYKGKNGGSITFPADFNETFDQFVKSHGDAHPFKKLTEKDKLVEMKKAFNVATKVDNKAAAEIDVKK